MKRIEWFGERVIPANVTAREGHRQELLAVIDKELEGVYHYPALCDDGIVIWQVGDAWYWVDEEMEGDIFMFPRAYNGARFADIQNLLATMQAIHKNGIAQGEVNKTNQVKKALGLIN